mmetsp:Transcript_30797/g.60086  ORF Transcript_30797/g.60086 Transcript_30797/m.60086 type:complete len:121 (+) Transcript_30797:403-765(+)
MQREFEKVADFAVVYIEEAHPTDGWMYPAVKQQFKIAQPVTLEERATAAARLGTELQSLGASPDITLCVDLMENGASLAFGALPERLVILQAGQVRFIGGKGPEDYSILACKQALEDLVA